jgi:hypothetical protein
MYPALRQAALAIIVIFGTGEASASGRFAALSHPISLLVGGCDSEPCFLACDKAEVGHVLSIERVPVGDSSVDPERPLPRCDLGKLGGCEHVSQINREREIVIRPERTVMPIFRIAMIPYGPFYVFERPISGAHANAGSEFESRGLAQIFNTNFGRGILPERHIGNANGAYHDISAQLSAGSSSLVIGQPHQETGDNCKKHGGNASNRGSIFVSKDRFALNEGADPIMEIGLFLAAGITAICGVAFIVGR